MTLIRYTHGLGGKVFSEGMKHRGQVKFSLKFPVRVPRRVKQEQRLGAVASQREALDARVADQERACERRLDDLDAALQVPSPPEPPVLLVTLSVDWA